MKVAIISSHWRRLVQLGDWCQPHSIGCPFSEEGEVEWKSIDDAVCGLKDGLILLNSTGSDDLWSHNKLAKQIAHHLFKQGVTVHFVINPSCEQGRRRWSPDSDSAKALAISCFGEFGPDMPPVLVWDPNEPKARFGLVDVTCKTKKEEPTAKKLGCYLLFVFLLVVACLVFADNLALRREIQQEAKCLEQYEQVMAQLQQMKQHHLEKPRKAEVNDAETALLSLREVDQAEEAPTSRAEVRFSRGEALVIVAAVSLGALLAKLVSSARSHDLQEARISLLV